MNILHKKNEDYPVKLLSTPVLDFIIESLDLA